MMNFDTFWWYDVDNYTVKREAPLLAYSQVLMCGSARTPIVGHLMIIQNNKCLSFIIVHNWDLYNWVLFYVYLWYVALIIAKNRIHKFIARPTVRYELDLPVYSVKWLVWP